MYYLLVPPGSQRFVQDLILRYRGLLRQPFYVLSVAGVEPLPDFSGLPVPGLQPLPADHKTLAGRLGLAHSEMSVDRVAGFLSAVRPELTIAAGIAALPAQLVQKMAVCTIHPALLPEAGGSHPLERSLLNGTPLGITLYMMGEQPQSGWRVCQEKTTNVQGQPAGLQALQLYNHMLDAYTRIPELLKQHPKPTALEPDPNSQELTREALEKAVLLPAR